MYDSLNPPPLPAYKIPITITINDEEQTGHLRPVDSRDPPCSFIVILNDRWLGTLHFFKPGWQFDNKDYPDLAEVLGEVFMLWYQ